MTPQEEPSTSTRTRSSEMADTAIILAGGLGTRLSSAIRNYPKVLAPAAGKPFLAYVLSYLKTQGIAHVILAVGYLAEDVRMFAGDGAQWQLKVDYSEEDRPLGTGGALRKASAQLARPFFAMNGDTLFLVDFAEIWQAHRTSHAMATISLRTAPEDEWSGRGCVTLRDDGRIQGFDEKPTLISSPGYEGLVSGGLYLLDNKALASIPEGQPASIERQVFPRLANHGQLAGVIQNGYFIDIGTPESLVTFETDITAGKVPVWSN